MERPSPVRVLFVDDDEFSFVLVRGLLAQRNRMTQFQVEWAPTYEQGLDAIRAQSHDCYLLDQQLGGRTGLELLRQATSEGLVGPFVFLTGHAVGDADLDVVALSAGAADFLSKDEINSGSLTRAVLYAVEQARLRAASDSLLHLKDDLCMARAIQQRMLRTAIPRLPGFDIAGACRPAAEAGGDFFDAFTTASGRLGVVVADVSSHGIGPALIMAATRRLVRTLARVTDDLSDVLVAANEALMEDIDDFLFVTMFFSFIDLQRRLLWYTGAGHEGYLLRSCGKIDCLESTCLPLGVVEGEPFVHSRAMELEPGDVLLLVTDGFQEARSPRGAFFGRERTLAVVQDHRGRPARDIIEALLQTVFCFCQPGVPQDDLTAVIVRIDC